MNTQKKESGQKRSYSAEDTMLNLMSCLVGDFQDCSGYPGEYFELQRALRTRSVPRIRESVPTPAVNEDDSYRFKRDYQLQTLLKRFRFSKDTYTDDELQKRACEGFLTTQSRLVQLKDKPQNSFYEVVLDTAREYITKVLGVYDAEEHLAACRFGSGATVGVRSALACEAQRWEWPISGTPEQVSWFLDNVVQGNPHILNYWSAKYDSMGRSCPDEAFMLTDSLTLTLVPKSFKALRSIMPNTTIGSYYTDGLRRMMERRLKRNGYDVSTLQMQHRDRARLASIHGMDATVDLSAASDYLSVSLIERLVPKSWFDAMNEMRIPQVVLPDGTSCKMETFCTMGIGFTFPLQTLVFLALLKATEKWSDYTKPRNWARITVYGDDMIFNREIYGNVKGLFEYVGLVVNVDKSFADGPFRESCGGDYHHGVDVRPFQPESDDSTHVGKNAYEALLYKFINGLRRRWTEQEIPRTLNYLVTELGRLGMEIKIVPPLHPDVSGIQCSAYRSLPKFLEGCRCAHPKVLGNGVVRFSLLRLVPEEAKEERHEPYYWVAMGVADDTVHTFGNTSVSQEPAPTSRTAKIIERTTGVKGARTPLLLEHKQMVNLVERPSFIGPPQRKRVDLATYRTVRLTGRYTRQTGSTCFWDP